MKKFLLVWKLELIMAYGVFFKKFTVLPLGTETIMIECELEDIQYSIDESEKEMKKKTDKENEGHDTFLTNYKGVVSLVQVLPL